MTTGTRNHSFVSDHAVRLHTSWRNIALQSDLSSFATPRKARSGFFVKEAFLHWNIPAQIERKKYSRQIPYLVAKGRVVRLSPPKPPTTSPESFDDCFATLCPIEFNDRLSIESLLGTLGMDVLQRVLDLICDTSQNQNWPLVRIKVIHTKDFELPNWQYVLVVMFFASDFDTADNRLHELYNILDNLGSLLTNEEAEVIQKKLFFDVQTTI